MDDLGFVFDGAGVDDFEESDPLDDSFDDEEPELAESFVEDEEPASLRVFEVLESFDEDELSESFDDPPESDEDPGGVVACEPRLSVLKNPEPLNVTPTGWNTFLTGSTFPVLGWAISVSESSVNACCTSMVSPDLTNL